MGTDKRARQKANRQKRLEELEVEQKTETREQSTKRIGKWVLIAAVVIGLIVLFGILRGGGDDDNASDSIEFAPTPLPENAETAPVEAAPLADTVPDDFVPFAGEGALASVLPTARADAYDQAPPMTIDQANDYIAVMRTDAGTIRLELFADSAPITVNNFVSLARDGFYDGVGFHRVLEGFMAQGGDPTGSGSGGPGYQFADEFDPTVRFDRPGLLAMANAGAGTNGSQFFITFAETPNLNDRHTIFGQLANPEDPAVANITLRDPSSSGADSITPTLIESVQIVEVG